MVIPLNRLVGQIWRILYIDDIHGFNFLESNNDISSNNLHAVINMKIIISINTNVVFLVAKILDDNLQLYDENTFIRGVEYLVQNNVDIINIPIKFNNLSAKIIRAITEAYENNILIVTSSGNDGQYGISEFSRLDEVLSVGCAFEGNLCEFSSYGEGIDLVAPGKDIIIDNNTYSGTSLSDSYITGLASLVYSYKYFTTPDTAIVFLFRTAIDLNMSGEDIYTGKGQIDQDLFISVLLDTASPSINIVGNKILVSDNVGLFNITINGKGFDISKSTNFTLIVNSSSSIDIMVEDLAGNRIHRSIDIGTANFISSIFIFLIFLSLYFLRKNKLI